MPKYCDYCWSFQHNVILLKYAFWAYVIFLLLMLLFFYWCCFLLCVPVVVRGRHFGLSKRRSTESRNFGLLKRRNDEDWCFGLPKCRNFGFPKCRMSAFRISDLGNKLIFVSACIKKPASFKVVQSTTGARWKNTSIIRNLLYEIKLIIGYTTFNILFSLTKSMFKH